MKRALDPFFSRRGTSMLLTAILLASILPGADKRSRNSWAAVEPEMAAVSGSTASASAKNVILFFSTE